MNTRRRCTGLFLLLVSFAIYAATPPKNKEIRTSIFQLTRVMIHDVVDPPNAARYYTYALLPAYLIQSLSHNECLPLERIVRHFKATDILGVEQNNRLSSMYSILEMGKKLLPSGYMLEEEQRKLLKQWKKQGYSRKELNHIVQVAIQAVSQILKWTSDDGYNQLSTLPRYIPSKKTGSWYPTPPGYLAAVQPRWNTIRPVLVDSAQQFKPQPPAPFDTSTSSGFYQQLAEVYTTGKHLSEEQRMIAAFWDCNPFVINTSGHMMIGFKKMSPGGHWMEIAGIVTSEEAYTFEAALQVQMLTAMALMDAFISCWDEKYRSNRIRPETAINKYIDRNWQPILQTPPFPEYTSGHSVISTAVSEVLSYLLGDKVAFKDDSEVIFGLPVRHFESFRQAADEAAISRLYGGIHYRDAIEEGQVQGRDIGKHIIRLLQQKGIKRFLTNP